MSSETTGTTGLAGRYAAALYGLADAASSLDKVAEDLKSLRSMINDSADLRRVISSPVLTRGEQVKAMMALCAKASMDDLTSNFVGTVAQNRRLPALQSMIAAYLNELSRRRGEATAQVTTAKKLSDAQLQAVSDVLKKAVGSKISIEADVDESLLGGMIVKVGSRMIDSSLKTQLQQLHLSMKGIG
ncbi:F0F1 ATP synthase subunit delta [Magnetovibrio sp.]|uniref:F0F1 ATP synthase subunit delta n=1 Tax=Magnetovibrio sp. TaxID=2024836 RepID=UPI002F9538F8